MQQPPAKIDGMDAVVADKVKKERSCRLHHLSEDKKRKFSRQNFGREVNVLFESDNSMGFMHGFSENYIKVKTTYNPHFVNQIVTAKLENYDVDSYLVNLIG